MGAPFVLPIPPLLGQIMFWGGAIALIITLIWPWLARAIRKKIIDRSAYVAGYGPSLSEAAIYISQESRWIVSNQKNNDWVSDLETELRDRLSLGVLRAIGRSTSRIIGGASGPLVQIPKEHWTHAEPYIIDGLVGNQTANASGPVDRPGSYFDIHVHIDDLEHIWRPLNVIQHLLYKPLKVKRTPLSGSGVLDEERHRE